MYLSTVVKVKVERCWPIIVVNDQVIYYHLYPKVSITILNIGRDDLLVKCPGSTMSVHIFMMTGGNECDSLTHNSIHLQIA